MRLQHLIFAASAALAGFAWADQSEIKIAHIIDKSGPIESFANASSIGMAMGLEYATDGKMEVAGKKITVLTKDSQFKPDLGKALLHAAYNDDKVAIAVGPTGSNVALAMVPVARENKKVLMLDAAAAEYLTGKKGNRYIFRTGRNSDQEAYSNAAILGRPGNFIATLAPDYAFGRESIQSLREALSKTPGKLVHEEFAPLGTTDFTAQAQRIFNALKNQPGRKILWMTWVGAGNPFKILDLEPQRYGIEVVTGGMILPVLPSYKPLVGMEGATHYYFQCPKNAANDWLVKEHFKRYGSPPDFFTATGMMSGIAIVEALKKTKGNTDTETLIKALEGMRYESPKGKVYFNPDNHQLMQAMYHFRIKLDDKMNGGVGMDCVKDVKIEEMNFPVEKLK